eukprot:scaffold15.g4296.t1
MIERPGNFLSMADDRFMPNDHLSLSVGAMTADDGSELCLPEAQPLASRVFAGAVAAAGGAVVATAAALISGAVEPEDVLRLVAPLTLGARVVSLLPVSLGSAAVAVGALLLAGGAQERLLGRGHFATFWVLSSLATVGTEVVLYAASGEGWDWGPGAPVLGLASSMAGFLALNWRTLSAGQRLSVGGGAAAAAAACLAAEREWVDAGYAAAALVGLALGYLAGPKYIVMRETIIPDMALTVPTDEEAEYQRCVVDQRTGWRSHAGTALVAGVMVLLFKAALLLAVGGQGVTLDKMEDLLEARPDIQRELLGELSVDDKSLLYDLQSRNSDLYGSSA